jgi:hypothetical protein
LSFSRDGICHEAISFFGTGIDLSPTAWEFDSAFRAFKALINASSLKAAQKNYSVSGTKPDFNTFPESRGEQGL